MDRLTKESDKEFDYVVHDDNMYDEHGYNSMGYPKTAFDSSLYIDSEDSKIEIIEDKKPDGISVGDIVYHKMLGESEVVSISDNKENKYIRLLFFSNHMEREFSIKGFDDFLSFRPFETNSQAETSYDDVVYEKEKQNLNWTLEHVEKILKPKLEKELRVKFDKLYNESLRIDTSSGIAKKTGKDYRLMEEYEFNTTYSNMKENPYFARFAFNDEDYYVSKSGVEAKNVIDWHNPLCQYYYQYDKYFGNRNIVLKLIRDLSVAHGRLFEYIDKFNIDRKGEEKSEVIDNHINQIIKENRKDKKIHDIVTSIKKNQYEIMTSDFDRNVMVLGCAGSGKTMILIHRMSYILFNSENINPNDIFIVSPTEYLKTENSILSELPSLKLGDTQKVTIYELFRDQLINYFKTLGAEYFIDDNIKQSNINMNKPELYTKEYLEKKIELFNKIMTNKSYENIDFIVNYKSRIQKVLDSINNFDEGKKLKIHEKYRSFIEECSQYSLENIYEMEEDIDIELRQRKELESIKKIISILHKNGCFCAEITEDGLKRSDEFKKSVNAIDGVGKIIAKCNGLKILYNNIESLGLEKLNDGYSENVLDYMIENLNKSGIIDENLKENVVEFISKRSGVFAEVVLELIDNKLELFKNIEHLREMLNIVKKNKYLGIVKQIHPKSYRSFLEPIVDIFKLFDFDLERKNLNITFKINEFISNPMDYLDLYFRLLKEQRKIVAFDKGEEVDIIFSVLSYVVNEKYLIDKEKIVNYDWQVFIYLYILNNLVGNDYNGPKRYVFVDEFQDLSITEIELIKDLFPGAVINLYGDFKQCISKKGVRNEDDIKKIFPNIAIYKINENYRNAYEITSYINKSLNMNMAPIGIKGIVEKLSLNLDNFKIDKHDRIVYIVKDKEHVNYNLMNKLGIIEGWKGYQKDKIKNEVPIALTVQDVKGLEFETVIVDDSDMTYNEKYVACTRALSRLYLLNK